MAVSYVSSNKIESATMGSMPSHQAGDTIVMFAFRRNNNTAPALPSGWTSLQSGTGGGAGTASARLAFKVATSSSETSGTWTNATLLICHVYRGAVVAASSLSGASSATVNYPALTLQNTSGSGASWVAGFAGHNSTNGSLATAPTGMTNRQALEGSTADGAGHDTNGTVSSWTSKNVSSGETSSGYRVALLELRPAASFYISAAGNNSNSGQSTGAPWLDWTNLNGKVLGPGDTIAWRGGDTVTSLPWYIAGSRGVAAAPITFTSYGTGKATLSQPSTASAGWYANDTSGWVFSNLIMTGPGATTTQNGLQLEQTVAGPGDSIQILNCEISGFRDGISIGGYDYAMGYSNLVVDGCLVHDNWRFGLIIWGGTSGATYSHSGVTVTNTKAYNATGKTSYTDDASGVGMGIFNCSTLTLQNCVTYDNGPNNGGYASFGITIAECKDVTVRSCISYNNQDNLDQGGYGYNFDTLAGTSLIENCLSYGNGGQGFVIANGVSGATVTLRYCIGWGDATQVGGGCAEMDLWTPGGTILVYNNTFVSRYDSVVQVRNGGSGAKFHNNIFYAASGTDPISTDFNYTSANLLFAGNLYYTAGTFAIYWNGTIYSSVAAWRSAKSQEILNSVNRGVTADPLLAAVGTSPSTTDPAAIGATIDCMKIQGNSPAYQTGIDYTTLGIGSPGTRDYWGNEIITAGPSIGAHLPMPFFALFTEL